MEEPRTTDATHKFLHDITGPLSVVRGFLKAIEGAEMTDDLREFFEAAVRSAEKVETIIDTLEKSERTV